MATTLFNITHEEGDLSEWQEGTTPMPHPLELIDFLSKMTVEQRNKKRLRIAFLVGKDDRTYRIESTFEPPFWNVYEVGAK